MVSKLAELPESFIDKVIVVYGPRCTGKTMIAQHILSIVEPRFRRAILVYPGADEFWFAGDITRYTCDPEDLARLLTEQHRPDPEPLLLVVGDDCPQIHPAVVRAPRTTVIVLAQKQSEALDPVADLTLFTTIECLQLRRAETLARRLAPLRDVPPELLMGFNCIALSASGELSCIAASEVVRPYRLA